MSDYLYIPEAGASLDAFIRDAAQVAAQDAVSEHTSQTTGAHGGIVASTHLDAEQIPDPHKMYLNNSRGDSRYYTKTTADGRYILVSSKGQAGGVVPLNATGQIDEQYIGAVAITDVFEIASEAAMLALTAQRGDVAVRSDLNRSFMLRQTPASTLANWSELRTPTDAVLSVDGLTGAVNLASRYSALNHKARHAKGGPDAILPSDIEALSRVWDEGTQLAYGQDLDFRGDGVIVQRDATTGRIFVTISGVAAGLASEAAAGVVELATQPEVQNGTAGTLVPTAARLKAELDRRETPEAWIAPTLVNGWSNVGGIYAPAGYRKDREGRVYLRGSIGGGGSGTTALTLPNGYRPPQALVMSGGNNNASTTTKIIVATDGAVEVTSPNINHASLAGLVFWAN